MILKQSNSIVYHGIPFFFFFTVFILPLSSFSLSTGTFPFTCPLCSTSFKSENIISETVFGYRLDLKPYGANIAPHPLPICPKCNFVLFLEKVQAREKEALICAIHSEQYTAAIPGNTSYFLLATLFEILKKPEDEIAFTYLNASWQVEDDSIKYRKYLVKVEEHLKTFLKIAGKRDKKRPTANLLMIEILRLQAKFDEADAVLAAFSSVNSLSGQLKTIIDREKELIVQKNSQPQELQSKKGPAKRVGWDEKAYSIFSGLEKFNDLMNVFEIDNVYDDPENEMISIRLHSKNKGPLVNVVWWDNFYVAGEAKYNWWDLWQVYKEVEKKTSSTPWLREWRDRDTNRSIRVNITGRDPLGDCFGVRILDWNHSKIGGEPAYWLYLEDPGEPGSMDDVIIDVSLAKEHSSALITSSSRIKQKGTSPPFWLDTIEVFYDSYIIVKSSGQWEKRQSASKEEKEKWNGQISQTMKDLRKSLIKK